MATISTKAAEAVGYRGYPNVIPERVSELEAATQTFLKGNYVIGDTSGYVAIIATDNDGDALGIAARAGQAIQFREREWANAAAIAHRDELVLRHDDE